MIETQGENATASGGCNITFATTSIYRQTIDFWHGTKLKYRRRKVIKCIKSNIMPGEI